MSVTVRRAASAGAHAALRKPPVTVRWTTAGRRLRSLALFVGDASAWCRKGNSPRLSGLPALRRARLTDIGILEQARHDAGSLLRRDPDLALPEHAELRRRVSDLARHAGEAN